MRAYSPDTPSKLPEVGAPWRPVVEACSTWCRWLQAKKAEEAKREAIDRAAAVYFTDGAELAPPDISWKDEA